MPIDAIGLALLVLWVGAMQLMLDKGKELDWFHSAEIVALAVVAVVGFAFFLVWELTDKHPVVDLSLFRRRNFWSGALATAVGYGLFFGNVVILPLWLQKYMGYTATQAGMVMAPVGLLAIVLSPIVGLTVGKVDPRRYATFSFLVFALVLWMRSNFNTQADFRTIMMPTLIQGVAMAFFFIPLVTLTLSGLTPDRIRRRRACRTSRASPPAPWEPRSPRPCGKTAPTLHHAQLAEAISQGNAARGRGHLQPRQCRLQRRTGRWRRSTGWSTSRPSCWQRTIVFYASAVLFLLLIPLVWLARPARGTGGADAAAGAH